MVNCNPGDRLHRLRHRRPALLRAADAARTCSRSTTPRRPPARSPAWSSSSAGRPRCGWPRPSRTPASRSWAPARRPSTWPRSGARSARCWTRPGCPPRSTGMARSFAEAQRIAEEIGYPVLVRPSYVLGGRGMEIVYDEPHPGLLHRPGHPGLPGAPGAGRPVPRRRGGDRRRRPLRRHRALPRWGDGAHRGGRHPLRRLRLRAAADHPGRRGGRPDPAAPPGPSPTGSGCAG